MRRIFPFLILTALLVPLWVWGQAQDPLRDLKAFLPRIPPREPAEALKSFKLRPGFRIELVAAEPAITDPVAMEFDEHGRIYVVEYPEYNQYANPAFKEHGRIRFLEDANGDGRYEKSTVFADNLDSPTALACYDGGIFVGCVPDILYLKDTTGDGKADVRIKVFEGFARDKAGEAMLNSFRWGLDNRFHVQTSLAGGLIRSAGKPDATPVNVKSQHFLFDPRTKTFVLTSGGGQHGMSMDDWGDTFVCANSDPIHQIMYDGRYLTRNPYVVAPAAAINILPGGRTTKLFRISPVEPWRALRTKLRKEKIVPGSDEGGDPAGFFTAATGITVYRGHAWPEEYRGNVFVGEVSGNLVFRARLEAQGVGFVAHRADAGVEFLASTDIWFRPVQFAHGPDGNLYIVDMYRELIEGAAFLPPQILKHMDVAAGADRGRIYRIAHDSAKQAMPFSLGSASTAQLVSFLEHPDGWRRDTASRLLYERQDKTAVEPLRKLAVASTAPLGRLHALYSLKGLDALEPALVEKALHDPEPRVRAHAIRLAEGFTTSTSIRTALEKLKDDQHIRVRYQLAFSLGNLPGDMPVRLLAELAQRDGADSSFRLAILSSTNQRAGELFRRLLADGAFRAAPHGRTLLAALATQIGAAGRKEEIAAVIQALDQAPEKDRSLSEELVKALVSKASPTVRPLLAGIGAGKAGSILAELIQAARLQAVDVKASVPERVAAIRTLGLSSFAEVTKIFAALLKTQEPQPIQAAALETLARFDHAEVPALILKAWPGLSPQLRASAAETLFARPAWIGAFLDAVDQKQVAPGDVDPARLQLLQANPDPMLKARAAKLFAAAKLPRRQDVVDAYQKALSLKGDAGRGKAVFKKDCSACHRLHDIGNEVGADLSAIRNRGADAVLLNILDPNREVLPQFVTYVLVTTSGRILTGLIAEESANSLTLRRPDGASETILRIDIEELRGTGLSFMPEGLEKEINLQSMADLLAYLNSPSPP